MPEESKPKYNFSGQTPSPDADMSPNRTPAPSQGDTSYQPAVSYAAQPAPDAPIGLLAAGVVASLAVGIGLGWVYAFFVSLTGFGIAILTSAIGWVIGVVMVAVGRRNGVLPAALSVFVAIVALTLSRYFLVQLEVDKLIASGKLPAEVRAAVTSDPLGITIRSFGWSPMSVIVMLIGVWGAWKVPAGGVSHE